MTDIRVLIAEDEEAVRDTLSAVIAADPELHVVGTAGDAEGAIELALRERPDVALVDVRMPGGGGPRAAREITRRCPPTRVIALSAHEDSDTIITMMSAGARAYVAKSDSTTRILREIHRSVQGATPPAQRTAEATAPPAVTEANADAPPARSQGQRDRVLRVLRRRALSVRLQPIFDLDDGEIAGMQAFPRVELHPHRSADAWFAEAAAAGLLVELESEFLRLANPEVSNVPHEGFLFLTASPSALEDESYREALRAFPPERLVLGITDLAPVEDYAKLRGAVDQVRQSGIRIGMVDVGAGFASLRHVVRLAPDLLELDVALTDRVDRDSTRHAIIAALVSCADQIGAKVLATGVTFGPQLEELGRLGVDYVQGVPTPEETDPDPWAEAFSSSSARADAEEGPETQREPGGDRDGR
jgi:EAL domain-containing protein (putative c-di-GMP-specific phosphodiesterase class I)/FixJ family two-component response regulator